MLDESGVLSVAERQLGVPGRVHLNRKTFYVLQLLTFKNSTF